jgi:hypothetical protein
LKSFAEVWRFLLTAAIVGVFSIVPSSIFTLVSGSVFFGGPFALIVIGITFVIAVFAGLLVGIPALHLAKVLGWDSQVWKLSVLGLLAGIVTVAAIILLLGGGITSTEDWKVVFPPYAMFGGFGGWIAALSWYWLHKDERTSLNA